MRLIYLLFWMAGVVSTTPAAASDALKFGPAPDWVVQQPVPPAPAKPSEAPVAILLSDEQVRLDPGRITKFGQTAARIQTPEGLAAGNLSLSWNPATETLTVNRLEIRRGDKVIDVLKTGQKFTTMRRESNLEQATLTGVLTANIQPEDLQEGDILVLAATLVSADPVLEGHVESMFARWNNLPIAHAFTRLAYPVNLPIQVRVIGGLPKVAPRAEGQDKVVQIDLNGVEPQILPKNAPMRFRLGRMVQATDFRDWSDIGRLFEPLFRKAAQIPASGPLRDEIEKIRSASMDSNARARAALELVQKRVRYVALVLGQGGYVPASAEETWARRFGDCKAKTALLMAILKEFGIAAEAAAVATNGGDAIAEQLPMVGLFDHVLVRATIGRKVYWLDGTRSGDSDIDQIRVPNFGWGLVLTSRGGLVKMEPAPLSQPDNELRIDIDASAGALAEAKVTGRQTFRGDLAVSTNKLVGALTGDQRKAFFESYWKSEADFVTPTNTTATFDPDKGTYQLNLVGKGKLDWNGSHFWIPNSSIAFKADFERTSGLHREAPVAIGYPTYSQNVTTIRMPRGFFDGRPEGLAAPVSETLAGIEYRRRYTHQGDIVTVESSERRIRSEVPYKEAMAAQPRLRALHDDDLALTLPSGYRNSAADMKAMESGTPGSFSEYLRRGNGYLDNERYDEAIADLTKAIELKSDSAVALADRALAYLNRDRLGDAAKDIAAAMKVDANNVIVLHARALMAEKKDELKAAVALYDQAVELQPNDLWALNRKAPLERNLGQGDAALASSAKALTINPALTNIRLLRANIHVSAGRNADAAKEADQIVARQRANSYDYVVAARIYARVALVEKAMAAFDKAISIKPDAIIYVNRAQTRPRTDQAGRNADIEAALKLEPDHPDALALRAAELVRSGRHGEAAGVLLKVMKEDSDPASSTRTEYAIALWKDGKPGQARPVLADIRKHADEPVELNNYCWDLATAGIALDQALEACREAVKRKPEVPGYIDSLAFVELRLGNLTEALAHYDRAIELSPRLVSSLMGRSIVYARLGRDQDSADDLLRAKSIDPKVVERFADYGLLS